MIGTLWLVLRWLGHALRRQHGAWEITCRCGKSFHAKGCTGREALKAGAEAGRLQAIVDRLPKTADGVPIVPGMTVYIPHPRPSTLITEREVVAPYGKVACLTKEPAHCGCCEGTAHRQARECYSTREATVERDAAIGEAEHRRGGL